MGAVTTGEPVATSNERALETARLAALERGAVVGVFGASSASLSPRTNPRSTRPATYAGTMYPVAPREL